MTDLPSSRRRQGFAVASLVLGVLCLPTLGLVGVGALLGIIFGIAALKKAHDKPQEYGGKGLAIAGIVLSALSIVVMPLVIGIIAAIAIPTLLRARVSANETAAIADVRAMASAEAAYRAANGGYFDVPQCLADPSGCIPGYVGSSLVDPSLARLEATQGYRRWFHPGPVALRRSAKVSASSLTSFTFGLSPLARGQTGVRSFCTDATGRVCYFLPVASAAESADACPADCQDLR